MPVLLLPPRITPDSRVLHQAALKMEWQMERLENWRPPARLRNEDIALYGEPLFADIVAGPLGLALLETPSDWLTRVPRQYLQRDIQYATLAEAMRRTSPMFIKPAQDKCFPAGVYASGAVLPPNTSLLPEDTPVLLAEPVHWEIEFRCFVLERAAITLSPYLRDGELAEAEDGNWPASSEEYAGAEQFIQAVLADRSVALPAAIVVDIGQLTGKGWAIIEANAAWGSGIYGCSPEGVLAVLRRATVKDETITPEDRGWVRPLPEVF